tara:strand:+ start:168 stop:629 length:462 start_codon:yes stop_codon:yes gene_type:complete
MTTMIQSKPVDILLVEDNQADADLAIEALTDARLAVNIAVVDDGEKALKFLYHQGEYVNSFRPDLIFLDLNLPKIDGRQILERIKSDNMLKCIPVVVLTTSDDVQDVAYMYTQHANCYIKKPVDFNQFYKVVQETTNYWFTVVQLPPDNSGSV